MSVNEIFNEEKPMLAHLTKIYTSIDKAFKYTATTENIKAGLDYCVNGYLKSMDLAPDLSRVDELNVLVIQVIFEDMEKQKNEMDFEYLAVLQQMKEMILNSSFSSNSSF